MSRESFVFLIGFVVFFVPFLGIPGDWKEWIIWVSGALIMFSGYKLRRAAFLRSIMSESGEHKSSVFVETIHHEDRVQTKHDMMKVHHE